MTLKEQESVIPPAHGKTDPDRSTTDLETLAKQQGVKPVSDVDRLLGDFWPDEESADDFNGTVEQRE